MIPLDMHNTPMRARCFTMHRDRLAKVRLYLAHGKEVDLYFSDCAYADRLVTSINAASVPADQAKQVAA